MHYEFFFLYAFLVFIAPILGIACIVFLIRTLRSKYVKNRTLKLSLLIIGALLAILPAIFIVGGILKIAKDSVADNDAKIQSYVSTAGFKVYVSPGSKIDIPDNSDTQIYDTPYLYVTPKGSHIDGLFVSALEMQDTHILPGSCAFSTIGNDWMAVDKQSISANKTCRLVGQLKNGEKVYAQAGSVQYNEQSGFKSTYYGVVKDGTFIIVTIESQATAQSSPSDNAAMKWLNSLELYR